MSTDFGRHRLIYSLELLGPEFQGLDNDHRMVWVYCKVGPQSTSVGIYRLSTAVAVEDLGNLTAIEFDVRLLAVCERFGWRFDGLTRVLWIPDWLARNPPQSPNVVANWVKLLSNVPDCALKFEAVAAMGEYLKGLKPSFREPFEDYRQRLSKASHQPKAKPESQPQSHQRSENRDSERQRTGALARGGSDEERAIPSDVATIAKQVASFCNPGESMEEKSRTFWTFWDQRYPNRSVGVPSTLVVNRALQVLARPA